MNAVRGIQHLTLPKTATYTTEAYTIYPPIGDPSYIWKIADPSLATILPSGDSGDTLSIRARNIDGTTTLTVTDPVNRYTKTIPVTFGIPTLAGLDLSSGSYSPKFNPRTTTYTAKVPNRVTSLSLTPKAVALSRITVKGKQVAPGTPSNAIPLKVGANVITVVMAVPGTTLTRTYTINVTRAPSAVATLDDLSISGFALSPDFRSGKLNYVTQVPGKAKALKIRATATSSVARIQINGKSVQSGKLSKPVALKSGKSTLSIVVTATMANSTTKIELTMLCSMASLILSCQDVQDL